MGAYFTKHYDLAVSHILLGRSAKRGTARNGLIW